MTWHVFLDDYFLHMLSTLGATNFKPSEYQKKPKVRNHFPWGLFKMDSVVFKILVSYTI
jgi:hypothetical protein